MSEDNLCPQQHPNNENNLNLENKEHVLSTPTNFKKQSSFEDTPKTHFDAVEFETIRAESIQDNSFASISNHTECNENDIILEECSKTDISDVVFGFQSLQLDNAVPTFTESLINEKKQECSHFNTVTDQLNDEHSLPNEESKNFLEPNFIHDIKTVEANEKELFSSIIEKNDAVELLFHNTDNISKEEFSFTETNVMKTPGEDESHHPLPQSNENLNKGLNKQLKIDSDLRRISPRNRPQTNLFQCEPIQPLKKRASQKTRSTSSEKVTVIKTSKPQKHTAEKSKNETASKVQVASKSKTQTMETQSSKSQTSLKSQLNQKKKDPSQKIKKPSETSKLKSAETSRPKSAKSMNSTVVKKKGTSKSKDAELYKTLHTRSANVTPEASLTRYTPLSARKLINNQTVSQQLFEKLTIEQPKIETANIDIQTEEELASDSRTALVYDESMTQHCNLFSKSHPERPGRVTEAMKVLRQSGLLSRVRTVCSREVTKQEALQCHSEEYWELLETLPHLSNRELYRIGDEGDSIYVNTHTFTAAKVAAGSLIAVTDEVLSGRAMNGTAVIRPPGHHCKPERAMGFCWLGNVPIACHYAINTYNVKRILVLDWDVHHGNGTQEMFYEDERVFYISIHRYDHGNFYPGGDQHAPNMVGKGTGLGYNLNIGWNETKKTDGDYLRAFYDLILPLALEYQPELVFISAGFDSGLGDPLGNCKVTSEGYGMMTHHLMSVCGGRVIVALEGGYNLTTVAQGMRACTSVLLGDFPAPITADDSIPSPGGIESIDTAGKYICKYWSTLRSYRNKYDESLVPKKRLRWKTVLESVKQVQSPSFSDSTRTPNKSQDIIASNINHASIEDETNNLDTQPKLADTDKLIETQKSLEISAQKSLENRESSKNHKSFQVSPKTHISHEVLSHLTPETIPTSHIAPDTIYQTPCETPSHIPDISSDTDNLTSAMSFLDMSDNNEIVETDSKEKSYKSDSGVPSYTSTNISYPSRRYKGRLPRFQIKSAAKKSPLRSLSPRLTSPRLTSPRLTSPRLTSPRPISPLSPRITSPQPDISSDDEFYKTVNVNLRRSTRLKTPLKRI